MAQKLIIDTDPGIDDAFALTLAMLEPKLDVQVITATSGNVSSRQATRNVQTIIEQLDPLPWPRFGAASAEPEETNIHATHIHGKDGLGESTFNVAELHHLQRSDKLLCDTIHNAPHTFRILAIGPLTNLASAFRRDPTLPKLIQNLVIMGGSLSVGGNVTAMAEFNIYADPLAAREVFHSPVPKLLVPLDVTQKFLFSFNHFDLLPSEKTRAGKLLRQIIPFAFRSHHHLLGLEGIYLHDVLALIALVKPDLFQTKNISCDIETTGELTRGTTIVDRRIGVNQPPNIEVVVDVDLDGVTDYLWATLARAVP